jgi:hypothetical protein
MRPCIAGLINHFVRRSRFVAAIGASVSWTGMSSAAIRCAVEPALLRPGNFAEPQFGRRPHLADIEICRCPPRRWK